MGRHHIKLPDHLYISPPSPQPSSVFASASSFSTVTSVLSHASDSILLRSEATTRAFERRIPGFKTSAAFLSALRANLDLQTDTLDTPADTPDSLRPLGLPFASASLPPPSPLIQAMSSTNAYSDADFAPPSALDLPQRQPVEEENGMEEENVEETAEPQDPNAIPELSSFSAQDEASRVEALRLVADSVAQQRQRASRVVLFHPVTVGILAVALAVLHRSMYKGEFSDYFLIATTFGGIFMSVLAGIRALTGGYIDEAERVGTWQWLAQGRNHSAEQETGKKILGNPDDEIWVTKFGQEYIGAVIFRGVQAVGDSPTKKSSRKPQSPSKTEIRAWTVRQKYRNKGVGTALLEDAIRVAHDKGWAQAGIELADDHANSKVVLPKFLNGFLEQNERRTRKFVEKKVREYEDSTGSGRAKKRR